MPLRFPLLAVATLHLLGSATLAAGETMPPFIVQSHRGAGVLAAENTITAFELGWKLGTIPEADIRTTSDDVIVAFHDADFSRVVHGADAELKKKGVKDVTFAELSKLEVGAESQEGFQRRHVSSMDEIFAIMKGRPDRRLYLDIKQVKLPELAALVKKHEVAPQVILASTKMEVIHEWKRLLPDSNTLHWMGGTEESLVQRIETLKKENFADITQVQIHVRQTPGSEGWSSFQPSEAFLKSVAAELKPRHILFQSLPWGADTPEIYRHLLSLGVESFATDHPDVVMPLMRGHFQAEDSTGFLDNGVTAHRGSSSEYPENTLAAFRHALELGVDWIELDIFLTNDGKIVVSHDATTKRTGDRDLKIADSTYADLTQVDVATEFRKQKGLDAKACPAAVIPLLSDVLTLIKGQKRTRLSIQPKDESTQAAIELIREMKAIGWVGFNDGSLDKMSLVKKMEPGIPVFWDRPATGDLTADIRIALERGFETLVINSKGFTEERILQCHKAGLKVGSWTVNDVAEMRQFLSWGIDRLYTDDPRALVTLKGEMR